MPTLVPRRAAPSEPRRWPDLGSPTSVQIPAVLRERQHPKTGKYRRTRLFVLTLGYSRKAIRLLAWQSSTQTWAELHERAFRGPGGTVRVIVLDNLKEGVLTPDVYDLALNPLYRHVLAHYGVVALPCRVGDPDRKVKVDKAKRVAATAKMLQGWNAALQVLHPVITPDVPHRLGKFEDSLV